MLKPEEFLNSLSEAVVRIDFERVLQQNTPVRRLITCSAMVALVLATIYAPLFHIHTDTGEAPLLHAHFPELEIAEDESVVHMERPHSHAEARSVDVLTTTAAHYIHFDAAIQSTSLNLAEPQPSRGFTPDASPRAHAPPPLDFLTPRAPPA